jgi:hypothetical protein
VRFSGKRKRRALTVTVMLIMTSNLLYFWLPYRVAAVQLFMKLGGSRVFIGVEYSALNDPRYVPAPESPVLPQMPRSSASNTTYRRAIPVKRLAWNMIINDRFGEDPVVVALCTITDAAMAYRATYQGRALHFRPIGLARNNLVLRDEETQSSWQQFTRAAIAGPLAGGQLQRIPIERLPWKPGSVGTRPEPFSSRSMAGRTPPPRTTRVRSCRIFPAKPFCCKPRARKTPACPGSKWLWNGSAGRRNRRQPLEEQSALPVAPKAPLH